MLFAFIYQTVEWYLMITKWKVEFQWYATVNTFCLSDVYIISDHAYPKNEQSSVPFWHIITDLRQ